MGTSGSLVTRRDLLRSGVLAGAAALLAPLLGDSIAKAQIEGCPTPVPGNCNSDRPTSPSAALAELMDGNGRWSTMTQEHPGEDMARRCCVINGQQPFAAILSCSDSRVPPELLFDQGLGDLFPIRVAGNTNTPVGQESLAYAVTGLSTPARLLFVLGHQSCGAVSAAVSAYPNPRVPRFVKNIYPAVKSAKKILARTGGNPDDNSQVMPVAVDQNAILTALKLSKEKPFRQALSAGTLLVASGRYDLTTQQVTVLSQISD
ncbi:MAG: carbonic anhydrase [Candidatus Binataceae bacterium]